jgi:hypothetical protein
VKPFVVFSDNLLGGQLLEILVRVRGGEVAIASTFLFYSQCEYTISLIVSTPTGNSLHFILLLVLGRPTGGFAFTADTFDCKHALAKLGLAVFVNR